MSSVMSGVSMPVRTLADPSSSKFTPAQEGFQSKREGFLGPVVDKPHTFDSALSNT
jgi:hypothetical protein